MELARLENEEGKGEMSHWNAPQGTELQGGQSGQQDVSGRAVDRESRILGDSAINLPYPYNFWSCICNMHFIGSSDYS